MGPMRIRHRSYHFASQSSHFVDRTGWQAKMASIEIWIPWRKAHGPIQWKPFWLAAQLEPQSDWSGKNFCVSYTWMMYAHGSPIPPNLTYFHSPFPTWWSLRAKRCGNCLCSSCICTKMSYFHAHRAKPLNVVLCRHSECHAQSAQAIIRQQKDWWKLYSEPC